MKKILVTGANGFVGKHLCHVLLEQGYLVRAAVRSESSKSSSRGLTTESREFFEYCVVGDIDSQTNWDKALDGVDIVIHLAARVHVMNDQVKDPLAEFRKVNVEGTKKLAESAAAFGIKRFIYLSSIKVNGESTDTHPFTENDLPKPQDSYGISKLEAEQVLHNIKALQAVILRPTLVYGLGVRANFLKLIQLVKKGLPLPLASVKNRRSMVYVGNLVSAIIACLDHPKAARQTFLVSDGEDLSTPGLIHKIAEALKITPKLFPCPPKLLKWAVKLTGKSKLIDRLLDSLQVDSSKIQNELDWRPPYSVGEGLKEMIKWCCSKDD